MKIFVAGSTGYIARHSIARLLANKLDVVPLSSQPSESRLEFNLLKPQVFNYGKLQAEDLLLLPAGVTAPELCHNQADLARAINVTGTRYAIEAAIGRRARIVFFSSDTVYGPTEAETEAEETATLKPFGAYAKMKWEIETQFSHIADFKVLRLSYVFSRSDKFTDYLNLCARERRSAEIFHPLCRRVVYLEDLLDLIVLICTSWHNVEPRVINVCGPELVSRVDLACAYREVVAPDLDIKVVEPPAEFFHARPPIINASNSRMARLLGRSPRNLREAMHIEFGRGDRQ